VLGTDTQEFCRDVIQRRIPACRLSVQHRRGQAIGQGQGVFQRRAFGTEAAKIRRVRLIALWHAIDNSNATADPAIGTGGARHTASPATSSGR